MTNKGTQERETDISNEENCKYANEHSVLF